MVWLPTLKSDSQAQAEIRITEFADMRLRYFWDGDNATGTLWQSVLGLKVVPWDIYLLYSLSAQWEKEPTVPDYWMHQLGDEKINGAPRLDRAVFESKLKELLNESGQIPYDSITQDRNNFARAPSTIFLNDFEIIAANLFDND